VVVQWKALLTRANPAPSTSTVDAASTQCWRNFDRAFRRIGEYGVLSAGLRRPNESDEEPTDGERNGTHTNDPEQAEAACMDAIFVADHVAMWDTYESNLVHYANARLEPVTMLTALAAVTGHIGLVSEPYNIARAFASLIISAMVALAGTL